MRITQLQLQNIGAFENENIVFNPKSVSEKAEIHIFVGENGTGKSTILYALAASLNTNPDLISKRYRNSQSSIKISFSNDSQIVVSPFGIDIKGDEREITEYLGYISHYQIHKFNFAAFAFSGSRSLASHAININGDVKESPFENALDFEKSTNSALLSQWIANTITKSKLSTDKQKAENYRQTLVEIEKMIAEVIEKPFYFDLDADTLQLKAVINNQALTFDVLPDGLKSMIAWMGDLLMRLDRMPWTTNGSIMERCFILFLDEIEIHLHPTWQRKILPNLQKLFKNAQIFISTHSPFVVNSVNGAWVYELEYSDGKTSITEVF